jgi:H+/Cl- antiporter ClcA
MTFGKLLIIASAILFVLGLIVSYAPWLTNWFGKLPGDIRIESENSLLFIPFTSMLIISVVLTIFINLFFRR